MTSSPQATAFVDHYVARVQKVLEARLPPADKNPAALHEAMRYSVLNGGKRIRPLLCYAAGAALELSPEKLDTPGCAVELIHAYSLVHDDLPAMDDDALRRGRPTTHKAFGTATAILAGDALQTLAFTILARDGNPAMLRTLTNAAGADGMIGGQMMDLAAEDRHVPLDELESLHRHKTGCLIRAAVLLACDAEPETDTDSRARLDRFAGNIGLAFQIRDDILDVEGDTAVIGKTRGADAAHGKSTYPALMGMDEAKRHADNLYAEARTALDPLGDAAEPLRWMGHYIVQRDR